MDKNTKNQIKKQLTVPAIVAMIATVFMIASVFLPYGVAIDERAEWIEEHPDSVVYEDLNITASDMKNVSILEYTRIYYTLCEELWHDSFLLRILSGYFLPDCWPFGHSRIVCMGQKAHRNYTFCTDVHGRVPDSEHRLYHAWYSARSILRLGRGTLSIPDSRCGSLGCLRMDAGEEN